MTEGFAPDYNAHAVKTHLLIPFIITFALSVAATVEAGSPTSSPGEVTLVNSPDDKVKLVGVEFGHGQIFVTLQNTTDKDITELSVSVHFGDSRGPYIWTGTPERPVHSLGAHSIIKIGLSKPDMSDDKEDFNQLLKMKKKYVMASVLVSKLVFKDNSTGDHTQ